MDCKRKRHNSQLNKRNEEAFLLFLSKNFTNSNQTFHLEAVSLTTLKQPVNEQNRRISMDIFSQRSISNELLKGLRYLTSINKTKDPKAVYTWGQLDPNTYGRNLIAVCSQVKDILKTESRLLELNSPMYIMGNDFTFFFF
ncbi:hypothetical protein NQ314_004371 [Rhamnusium bicolor]|uniref:Uncharacterized protein n=1 Tax=Rhamnusium bicolor TaxID=1586634 RepID=A0AAV8ZLW5_9CUCU|nr:hypothetical protein NQ314_004371 [Rhamnusium bicolor]